MNENESAGQLLERLLAEREEEGRRRGDREGYLRALDEVIEAAREQRAAVVASSKAAPQPGSLQPHLQRALDYVGKHPGTTASKARGIGPVLYKLSRLGMVRKEGPQFFPVERS